MKKAIIPILIIVILSVIVVSFTDNSFRGQGINYNRTFTGNQTHSLDIINIPLYSDIDSASFKVKGYPINISKDYDSVDYTYYIIFEYLNMTDGCFGEIALLGRVGQTVDIMVADQNIVSALYNYYSSGVIYNGSIIELENSFAHPLLQSTDTYIMNIDYKAIQYVDMNNSNLNGYNDTGSSSSPIAYNKCRNLFSGASSGYCGSGLLRSTDYIATSITCLKSTYHPSSPLLYNTSDCSNTPISQNNNTANWYVYELGDSCRSTENYVRSGGTNATGTCTDIYYLDTDCATCTTDKFGIDIFASDGCTIGTEDSCQHSLCTYAGSFNFNSTWMNLSNELNFTFSNGIKAKGYIINTPYNPYIKITKNSTNSYNLFQQNESWNGTSEQINFSTTLQDIVDNECICTGCTLSGSNCSITLNTHSDTPGIIEFTDLEINYTYSESNLTVNFYDSTTLNKITNTEVTVQLIGSVFQYENYTNTGQLNLSFPFAVSVADDITVRAYSRNNTDYSIVINNITLSPGVDKTLDLYLTNTSNLATTNLVTFYVYDEDYSTLEGATIHIELQNPSTNTYLPITSLTTNSNGQATTILATDTFFYRWYVDYKGKEIYRLTDPVSLSLNDDLIYIVGVIEEKYSDEVTQILDNYVDLHFNTTSNITGFFEVDYNMVDPVEMCIYVYIHNQSGTYLNTTSCENATFGTLQTGILTPSNRTYYVSFAKVDFKDGEGYIIMDTSDEFLGRDGKVLTKSQGLFILIILTLASVMGFIASPIIGLIIFMVGVIGISLMPFIVGFKIGTAMIMVSLALITAVTISGLKK